MPTQQPVLDTIHKLGKLTRVVEDKGYGFISPVEGGSDLFFHIRSCNFTSNAVKTGDVVQYTTSRDASGKLRAHDVRYFRSVGSQKQICANPACRSKGDRHFAEKCPFGFDVSQLPIPKCPSKSPGKKTSAVTKSADVKVVRQDALQRLDPGNGQSWTWDAFQRHHQGRYSLDLLKAYWGTMPFKSLDQKSSQKMPLENTFSQLSDPKADWDPLQVGEIEFLVDSSFPVHRGGSLRSASLTVGTFSFKVLVYPRGEPQISYYGLNICTFAVFVMADPPQGSDNKGQCSTRKVKVEVTLVNWKDFTKSKTRSCVHTFTSALQLRHLTIGWRKIVDHDKLTTKAGWIGPCGSICVRARCTPVDDAWARVGV